MSEATIPEAGQAVLVRGRPAVVADVRAHQTNGTASHLVEVEYFDEWDVPAQDSVVWEAEVGARVLRDVGLPRLERQPPPDPPERMAAFLDALRWSSTARLPGLTSEEVEGATLFSPWESAVMVEPYQLYPVMKALEMPRVSLLLADDVGLGKTIEAGLVLRELLARRRIRRILVICPASLQLQWQEELRTKFSMDFVVLDRDATTEVQRQYGMDANPWSVTPRAITSMDFLRQPDVLSRFEAAASTAQRGHSLPWDLLIADEAHNLAPRGFTDRSQRSEMLGRVSPHAEHRLFLSATPHNGFTASFSGLLELLDPVRFRQTPELTEVEREQVDLVMVRRLKSELNARAVERGLPQPFSNRVIEGVPFTWTEEESDVVEALREYRRLAREVMSRLSSRERSVGRFVFGLLTKRLLSSFYAFAATWWRHIEGFEEAGTIEEAEAALRRSASETADDTEKALREEDVAREGAGWLREYDDELREARGRVTASLERLGWTQEATTAEFGPDSTFPSDGKWDAFLASDGASWVDRYLRDGAEFRDDERAIVFTEYKDTLDYLIARLAEQGIEHPQTRYLFGGSSSGDRSDVKEAFNDPADPIRLLTATDVAAEGLNLQTSSRYVVHWEIPWNPMRMEQRNGRVDRHGQARDVVAFHFFSGEDEDLTFLDYVAKKIAQVREDLGSVGEVIDLTITERFETEQLDTDTLDGRIEKRLAAADISRDLPQPSASEDERAGEVAVEVADRASDELGLSPVSLRRLLEEALRLDRGELKGGDDGTDRLAVIPPDWQLTVDRTLRIRKGPAHGALPRLTFDSAALIETTGDRPVFRERSDVRLVRLSHPLMEKASAALRRRLWDPASGISRFTVSAGDEVAEPTLLVPSLLSVVNELREPLHSELVYLGAPLSAPSSLSPDSSPDELTRVEDAGLDAWREHLSELWDQLASVLRDAIERLRADWESKASELLPAELERESGDQIERFRIRISELAIDQERREAGLKRTREELERAELKAAQLSFDPDVRAEHEQKLRSLTEEAEARELRLTQERRARLRTRLEQERERLVDEVLPRRYSVARCQLTPTALVLLVPPGSTP